jgi:hypothetical protein
MFGFPGELVVAIPDRPPYYSLYADGPLARKVYSREAGETLLSYPEGAVVFLYYTYPSHRAATCVRNVPGGAALPGLSRKVAVLFTVDASRVDKLKRSIGHLNMHAGGAYHYVDAFYLRLYFVLQQRGRLNYTALRNIAERFSKIGALSHG